MLVEAVRKNVGVVCGDALKKHANKRKDAKRNRAASAHAASKLHTVPGANASKNNPVPSPKSVTNAVTKPPTPSPALPNKNARPSGRLVIRPASPPSDRCSSNASTPPANNSKAVRRIREIGNNLVRAVVLPVLERNTILRRVVEAACGAGTVGLFCKLQPVQRGVAIRSFLP